MRLIIFESGFTVARVRYLVMAIALALAVNTVMGIAPAEAACSVPNSITNGQTADATAVMGNFNALKDCANLAVLPSGTPAVGSLSVFSGASTITSGNLSGDCMTAGSLGVTCTKTNGVSLGYFATGTDAGQLTGTVSVNRFNGGAGADASHFLRGDGVWAIPAGGGGGGGGSWDFVPPSASEFTSSSSGDTTNITLSDDTNEGLLVDSGVLGSGDRFRIAAKSLPSSGNSDWEVFIKYKAAGPGTANTGIGIAAQESATGKHCSLIFNTSGASPTMYFMRGTLTVWSAVIGSMQAEQRIGWLKLAYVNSTGTLTAFWGVNGKQWQSLGSVTNSTAFTTRADKVGFVVQTNTSAGPHNYMSVPYWHQSF
jgi:hypothetical protein